MPAPLPPCLLQVMEGMQEGTLFDRDAVEAEEAASARSCPGSEDEDASTSGRDMALQARAASRRLQAAPTEVRDRVKHWIAFCLVRQNPRRLPNTIEGVFVIGPLMLWYWGS